MESFLSRTNTYKEIWVKKFYNPIKSVKPADSRFLSYFFSPALLKPFCCSPQTASVPESWKLKMEFYFFSHLPDSCNTACWSRHSESSPHRNTGIYRDICVTRNNLIVIRTWCRWPYCRRQWMCERSDRRTGSTQPSAARSVGSLCSPEALCNLKT